MTQAQSLQGLSHGGHHLLPVDRCQLVDHFVVPEHALASALAPNTAAVSESRTSPSTRETMVAAETTLIFLRLDDTGDGSRARAHG
jgi:hypothetical protein